VKTSEFIAALAADPVPEPVRLGRRVAAAIALGLVVSLTIFALRVFGSADTNNTRSGAKALPSSAAASDRSSAASSSEGSAPGTSAQNTQATSPLTSCGTPTAAASATKGCATTADSSSAGPSRLPAMFSVSSERPCRNQKPSSSTNAQSPCTQTPGSRRQYVSR